MKNNFYKEIDELLSIQIEINPYFIPEATFDYENSNGRYDELSLKETILLMSILCSEE